MFQASAVLTRMLAAASIAPDRLNRAMDLRIRHGDGPMLDLDHFPRLLQRATGLHVKQVVRRSRRLLIEVGYKGVRYREVDDRCCRVSTPRPAGRRTNFVYAD